ncbi:DUF1189 family protein [Mycoplasmatota bacterium WC30]
MIKFFVDSLRIKKIYGLKKTKGRVIFFYFILLILIISFPLNLQIIRSGGWDLYNFTAGMRETYPDWLPSDLPEDIEISRSGMYYEDTENSVFLTSNLAEEDLYIVFSPLADYVPTDRTLMFEVERISYYNEDGDYQFSANYSNVEEVVRFSELNLTNQSVAVNKLATIIEDSFGGYAQFKSVIYNTGINLVLNLILITVVAALFLLIRIKFEKVTNFGENIRIVIASMTLPAIFGMIIGLTGLIELSAFSIVIFQFATPIIAYIAIYKGAKAKQASRKSL